MKKKNLNLSRYLCRDSHRYGAAKPFNLIAIIAASLVVSESADVTLLSATAFAPIHLCNGAFVAMVLVAPAVGVNPQVKSYAPLVSTFTPSQTGAKMAVIADADPAPARTVTLMVA
jgi:hypothetical protein